MWSNPVVETIKDAVAFLDDVSTPLELWINLERTPERNAIWPDIPENINIGRFQLGPITRTERMSYHDDYLEVVGPDSVVAKVPYNAIYCVVMRGVHKLDKNWTVNYSERTRGLITYVSYPEADPSNPK